MKRSRQVQHPEHLHFRALCCDTLGFIKVVEIEAEKGTPQVVGRWGQPDSQGATLCTSLSDDSPSMFAVAKKNGRVEIINPVSGALLIEVEVPTTCSTPVDNRGQREDASDAVCGVHLFRRSSFWGRSVLTCTEKGVAAIRKLSYEAQDEDKGVSASCQADTSLVAANWSVSESGCILSLRVDSSERYAIIGGKDVDVSLWDLQTCSRLWSAKNPRRDNLGLIAPPYVTALTFLSKNDHRKFVVGTGHHQIRLYDMEAQRRPIMSFDYGESPIKSLTLDGDGYTIYVGTGSGDLACFDMRTGQNVGSFKGKVAGSIRAVVRHPSLPLIASCGLDRYLRIHHSKSRQLLAMLFLKQQLVSVEFDTSLPIAPSHSAKIQTKASRGALVADDLRRGMEQVDSLSSHPDRTRTVNTKTKRPVNEDKPSKASKKLRKMKSSGT